MILVWICESCGAGNLDSHYSCINCESSIISQSDKKIHCWDYLACDKENKERCIVYIKKNGNKCYDYKKISRRCLGHNDRSCDECEWFQVLHENARYNQ